MDFRRTAAGTRVDRSTGTRRRWARAAAWRISWQLCPAFMPMRRFIFVGCRPSCGFESWLASRTPERWRDRVFLHGLVPNDELLSRIAEHDIGFAGETSAIRSRDLTVTNKILHYLLGGLAVVASNTAGQREVAAEAPDAVQLYSSGNVSELAAEAERIDPGARSAGRARRRRSSSLRSRSSVGSEWSAA